MRITSLVTGGTGFIGSHVVKNLLELGHYVVVLDDLSGSDSSNLNPKADFHQGSILDRDLIASLFEQ